MGEQTIISLRVSTEFRKRLRAVALRNGKSVSAFIKERLEAELESEKSSKNLPTSAERAVLERFIGGERMGRTPTPEEIDRIVYGEP